MDVVPSDDFAPSIQFELARPQTVINSGISIVYLELHPQEGGYLLPFTLREIISAPPT